MMDKSKLFQRPEPKAVKLPELGGVTVFVHALSGREYMEVIRQVRQDQSTDEEYANALMVEASVRDESGKRFFEPGEAIRLLDDGQGSAWVDLYQATQAQNAGTTAGN